ncbi:MAG TPA: VWA domain-containing protein, partial [Gammaproteobacteria bacterium]
MKRTIKISMAVLIAFGLSGCGDSKQYETAMCALVDISGTYAHEKPNVVKIIKAGLIPNLEPGDSLFFITIDSNSYNEEDLQAKVTLDYIPSKANSQKLEFANKLDEFAKGELRSQYTDISGAMMLCSDYLKNTGSGNKAIIV